MFRKAAIILRTVLAPVLIVSAISSCQTTEQITPSDRNLRGISDVGICRLATSEDGKNWNEGYGYHKYKNELIRREIGLIGCHKLLAG